MATPQKGGMSLYANLLDSNADSSSSISRASVAFKQDDTDKDTPAKKLIDPALRFQPIRRPQVKQPKPKSAFSKAPPSTAPASNNVPATGTASATAAATAPNPQRSTLADWAPTEEDEWLYGNVEKRQRGGRRRKKKKDDEGPAETDWDEIYDPSRPTIVEEYLRSDERIQEVREWKAVLYAHRRRRRRSYDSDELSEEDEEERRGAGNQFAPPAAYSFAPPPMSPSRDPDAATGDDAYTRRLAMSGSAPPPAGSPNPPPPPPPPEDEVQPPEPPQPGAIISRAPVRYEPPPTAPASGEDPNADDEMGDDSAYVPPPIKSSDSKESAPHSNRPGQAGFAQRLMSKYGWTKGSGLGADESGITSALRVQVEKRRKKPDAEGGGWAEPGGRGKIIGGKRKPATGASDEGFGSMSQVIVLRGMLDGMADVRAEIEAGLGQEIGEECGEKYGRVERLYIDAEGEEQGRGVFIKFTDQVSALRAVNALQDRIFNGNPITAKFYDVETFEKGIYS
ncbi:hypothetical protein GQ53DRAFT_116568 [Thozetella sp. PMI_491]|nr:hypothetical protein GQ53DRAFT_116568 [Thozetella sp. PMI_491]